MKTLMILISIALSGCATQGNKVNHNVFLHDSYNQVQGCERLSDFVTDYRLSASYLLLGSGHERTKAKRKIRSQAKEEFNANHVVVSSWDDNITWFRIYSTAFKC